MASSESMRQRVEEVLSTLLERDAAAAAARRWTERFADQPGGGVVRFVQELSLQHTIEPTVRRRLRMDLFQAIYRDDFEIEARTAAASGSRPAAHGPRPRQADSGTTSPQRSPGQRVCSVLVVSMVERARHGDRVQFLEIIAEILRASPVVEEPVRHAFEQWDGEAELPVPQAEEGLRALVHATYVAFCELYGPAEADRNLRRCVQLADATSAASEFRPGRLL